MIYSEFKATGDPVSDTDRQIIKKKGQVIAVDAGDGVQFPSC